jgi:dihydroxyacetone kinase DhaKLM complex PTS-EIIA-like component DhaM
MFASSVQASRSDLMALTEETETARVQVVTVPTVEGQQAAVMRSMLRADETIEERRVS